MNCKELRSCLSQCLDGELEEPRKAQAQAHLADCPVCRQEVEAHRAAWAALDAWPAPKASPQFNRNFWRRIEQQQARVAPVRPRRRHWLVWTPLVAAAAAAVLLIAVLIPRGPKVGPSDLPVVQMLGELEEMAVLQDQDLLEYLDSLKVLEALEPEDWKLISEGEAS